MGEILIMIKWKVHAAPLGVQRWDGASRLHPRKWSGVLCPLCVGFQPKAKCGPFEKIVH